MNVVKKEFDNLNVLLSVTIQKEDYSQEVEKTLKKYRKDANIPGFRKGSVPMGMIRKQYEKAIQYDEVNKLIDKSLNEFFAQEKLNFLGSPLPTTKDIDWEADTHTFEFELGLTPDFQIDLKPKKGIRFFNIKVEESVVENQVERIKNQFGTDIEQEQVAENSQVKGSFFNQEHQIDKTSTIKVDALQEVAYKKIEAKKVGEQLTFSTKELFKDAHDLIHYLGLTHDQAHDLDTEVVFTIEGISRREPAELNQELFDKLFPASEVTSEEELKQKIRENAQQQYQGQAEQQLLNDVTDYLLEKTSFELPAEFLKKWLQTAGEKPLTPEQAEEEYNKSEKGLRYQLIESKIVADNKLHITFDELKSFAQQNIRQQMLQFGMTPEDKQVDEIVGRILKNREEVERLNQQLLSQKLIAFYKENVSLKTKEVSYDEFAKEVYGAE